MFDAAVLMGPLPEGSFFALLAEHGDRIVRDEDFADVLFGADRAAVDPAVAVGEGVVVAAPDAGCRMSRRWRRGVGFALEGRAGLPVDHQGWHPTSLTKFRARLLLHGKERVALENTLRLAEELGMLDGPAEQIVDSTPMLGAAATQDTVGWCVTGCAS